MTKTLNEQARELAQELGEDFLKDETFTDDQSEAILRLVNRLSKEIVILCKNRFSNL